MFDVKENSHNEVSHVMNPSSEKPPATSNCTTAQITKKVFKPKFPYLWIFGKAEKNETGDGDKDQISCTDSLFPTSENQNLKNGSFEVNSPSGNGLNFGINNSIDYGALMKDDSPPLYYGVSLPSDSVNTEDGLVDEPLVFLDKKEALLVVKKYRGARFKAFQKEDDAVAFASQFADEMCLTPLPVASAENCSKGVVPERVGSFRAPKCQDMVKLRKAIESGDEDYFIQTVWSNPRYLIGCCDTPAIMQEGFRYNGLHVAAKHKQPEMCRLILETIADTNFMDLMYSEDEKETRVERMVYLTDLYLNTPDKGLCETPLHFAAKFGCLEAVELLAFHPACDKRRKNKYGLEAREIICERCPSANPELKKKIEAIFQDHYFVPVLRSKDNSVQPVVGEPYCLEDPRVPYTYNPATNAHSPLNPSLHVVAVAGPMSPKDATNLYHLWKTPPSAMLPREILSRIRLRDPDKGLERVGRYLAQSLKASWTEYWPPMDKWCDLSSEIGLEILERHLRRNAPRSEIYFSRRKKHFCRDPTPEQCRSHVNSNVENFFDFEFFCIPSPDKSTDSVDSSSVSPGSSGISVLCQRLEELRLSDSEDSLLKTSPDMPYVLKSCYNPLKQRESPDSSSHVEKDLEQVSSGLYTGSEQDNRTGGITSFKLNSVGEPCLNMRRKEYKNELCSSTPKRSDSVNSSHYSGKDSFERISTTRVDKLDTMQNVVQSVLEPFTQLIFNSETTVISLVTLHKFLMENALPGLKSLYCLLLNEFEKETVHCDVAVKVYEEVQNTFVIHEMQLIKQYLAMYLESKFPNASSDDEVTDDRKSASLKPKGLAISKNAMWKHLICILAFVNTFLSNNEQIGNISLTTCQCMWEGSQYFLGVNGQEALKKQSSAESEIGSSGDGCSDEEYATPSSSPKNSSDVSTPEEAFTPDEGFEVFVGGSHPSKADADILRVLENVNVDPSRFPHVCLWKHLMSSFDREVIESWPSPSRRSYHQDLVCVKSRTPCRTSLSSPSEICSLNEAFTPVRNKAGLRHSFRQSLSPKNLCKKFLTVEEKE